ncbi:MAG: putative lipopolysaccharide biosynthesis protein [Sphingobacterium sp.]|nr:putative lipopolysaccharide biosynthesis protein [Sphingobacterium sp.]
MKVLHIITSLSTGGAERLIVDSVPIYQKKGCKVDVLVLKDENSIFRSQLEKESNGKVTFLSDKSIYNPFLVLKMGRLMKGYDVIHVHLFPALYWAVFAKILYFINVPIIYTEHSTDNNRRHSKVFKVIDRFVYRRLSFIGCISNATLDNLAEHLGNHQKMKVINNGIDISKFTDKSFRANTVQFFDNQDSNDKILIQVSSFRVQKDHETLINSLLFLPKFVKLLLVGEGPLKESRVAQVKKLKLEERVLFLGLRSDISSLLNASDIVVLSSKNEGFGLAIVEGMACKKPVLASNIKGLNEIVAGHGILFERGNEKDLAMRILELINDKNHYDSIAEKCYKRAMDFSIEIMVDKYIFVYENEKR